MSVLDTWYLLFRTDASGAKNDIAELDKQIAELAAKGRKRDEAESKHLKELRKQRQDATRDLKDQTQQVDKLGQSFVKMIEGGAQAATAIFAVGAIKNGILNAAQFNSALQVQGKLIGQNTGQLQAYAAAAQSAGGTQAGFLGQIQGIFQNLAASGVSAPSVTTLLDRLRAGAKQYNTVAGKELYFQRLGITDTGLKALLEQSDAEYAKSIAAAQEHARATEKDTEAARQFEKTWSQTEQSLSSAFTKLGSDIFPLITPVLKSFNKLLDEAAHHSGALEVIFTGMAATSIALSASLLKVAGALGSIVSAGAKGGLSVFGRLSALFGLGAGAYEIGAGIGDIITGKRESLLGKGAHSLSNKLLDLYYGEPKRYDNHSSDNRKRESFQFWLSQGYTPAQAAGLVANEQAESGFNPRAIGDSGAAHGSFQWHSDRIAKIKAATGIDVTTASHVDQLRAAAWELNHSGVGARLRGTTTAQEAGALISSRFERPANGVQQAILRGQLAAGIAQQHLSDAAQSPFNSVGSVVNNTHSASKNMSVKIENLNVHTQATDAEGISRGVGNALHSELRNAFSSFDDGVVA